MAHCNTSFHQMLQLLSRHNLAKLEKAHGTGRQARSFSRWDQCVHLLYMQLTGRCSLRDGIASLKAQFQNFYPPGIKSVVRFTFADANNKRPAWFLRRGSAGSISVVSPMLRSTSSGLKTSSTARTPLW